MSRWIVGRSCIALLLVALVACGGSGDGSGPPPLPTPTTPPAGVLGDGRLSELVEWARNSQRAPAMGAIVIRNGQVAERAEAAISALDGLLRARIAASP